MSEYQNQETASWDAQQVRRSEASRRPRRQEPEEHRPRRRRGHPILKLLVYLVAVVLTSALLASAGWLLLNDFCAFNKEDVEVTVEITADDDLESVTKKLQDAGLVQYGWFFKLFGSIASAEETIGIGSYQLNSEMDYMALINGMHNSSGGMNADTVRVTIPEGYTVRQIIKLLAEKKVNTEANLLEAAQTAKFDFDFISNTSQDISRLEGYLFPDTYDFYVNEKPSSALRRLIANFAGKMDEERMQKVEESGYSMAQVITIASLIEKESTKTDRAQIASVIYNRLEGPGDKAGTYGMLQVDASLLYALPDHVGAITSEDMQTDSKYNLYKNPGLPPTPIANPGIAAIDAALDPGTTDYYYYALGKDGTHHFFTNYNDHTNFVNSDQYAG